MVITKAERFDRRDKSICFSCYSRPVAMRTNVVPRLFALKKNAHQEIRHASIELSNAPVRNAPVLPVRFVHRDEATA